jgi:hypothetical protein
LIEPSFESVILVVTLSFERSQTRFKRGKFLTGAQTERKDERGKNKMKPKKKEAKTFSRKVILSISKRNYSTKNQRK